MAIEIPSATGPGSENCGKSIAKLFSDFATYEDSTKRSNTNILIHILNLDMPLSELSKFISLYSEMEGIQTEGKMCSLTITEHFGRLENLKNFVIKMKLN